MDTLRVDICYRPLRIGWVIQSDDKVAFRQAVKLSHTLWGGCFNPILMADREDEARRLIDLFRVDLLLPVGHDTQVTDFPKKFPHLHPLLTGWIDKQKHVNLLDVHNALMHLHKKSDWKTIRDNGFRIYNWDADDPLADVFLMQLGSYPNADETKINYREMVTKAFNATETNLDSAASIPADILDHPCIVSLSRHALECHYSIQGGLDSPGFFVGDASNLDDLVCHWNLCAANIALGFVDPTHIQRYANILPAWERAMRQSVAHRHEWNQHVAAWKRRENNDQAHIEKMRLPFSEMELTICPVSKYSWDGQSVRPPMMSFDQVSVLGVFGRERGKPRVSFPLSNKPFCGDARFHTQHLVASVSFIGGLYGDEQHTFNPPYIPELNEFYARTMNFRIDRLRIESERIGVIIEADDTDKQLYALPVADLVNHIFGMAGYNTKLSNGGLITRQLISRLNGLQGARVFKIPGVRRLIKTHEPAASFTKEGAIGLIAQKDSDNPNAKFSDHQDLFIEWRASGTELTPYDVFGYLVEKGLFRIGADLNCPDCRMTSWVSLDTLKQRVVCELCGHEHDATRQLVNDAWRYRRSGVLGVERHAQGAIPVALTLQQLEINLIGNLINGMYSPSLDLTKKGQTKNECEVDFVWIIPRHYPRKTAIILGECKDQGPIKQDDFKKDIGNLRNVAEALPCERFETFVLLAKLNSFTQKEIDLAKSLNTEQHPLRVILLTARELEPYQIYERTKVELNIKLSGSTPEDLASATTIIYFGAVSPDQYAQS